MWNLIRRFLSGAASSSASLPEPPSTSDPATFSAKADLIVERWRSSPEASSAVSSCARSTVERDG